MLISFKAKRVNKKKVRPGKLSWGLGRRAGPCRCHCIPTCQNGLFFAFLKGKDPSSFVAKALEIQSKLNLI